MGGSEAEREGERFSGLCRSVSVAEWKVPVFVPVPVSRCHPEACRHCFRSESRRSGLLPHLPALSAFEMGVGRGEEARLQTEPVAPKRTRDPVREAAELQHCLRVHGGTYTQTNTTHLHMHVHLLLFSRGIPGFLVNTAGRDSLSGTPSDFILCRPLS